MCECSLSESEFIHGMACACKLMNLSEFQHISCFHILLTHSASFIHQPLKMNDYQPYPVPPHTPVESGNYSSGASTRVQLAKEELICALCMSFYNNPRSLQCLHSYCEECLFGLHRSSGCSDTVQCPECRARTLLPADGITGKLCRDKT